MLKLIINVAVVWVGLLVYILIAKSKWGKAHEGYQYAIMLVSLLVAVAIGGAVQYFLL